MARLLMALALVLAACTATTEDPATTTTTQPVERDAGYVVWVSADGVFTMDMESGTEERLGPDDDSFPTQPTPGPGGRLAWSELTPTAGVIAIADSSGAVQRLEAPTSPFYYSWSPDGAHLAFLGPGPGSLIFGVVEEGQPRQVDTGAPYYFDWAPDGESLFVHRVGNDLGLLTLDGERVVIDESPATFQAPQWTDDGVVYAIAGAGTFAEGSPSGILLATADEPADLVIAPAPGEEPSVIATLSAFSAFDRAGTRVAVLSFDQPPTGAVTIVDVETGVTTEVARLVLAHRWSPDGTKLLMLRSDDDGNALWEVWEDGAITTLATFLPSTTFVRDYLPFWDQYSRSLTLWSPRSDAFTFAGRIDGESQPGVYVQNLDGSRLRLGDGNFSAWGES